MNIKKLISLMMCVTLAGCVAAVVAGAAGGLAVYDARSVQSMEKDARIFYVVHTAIVKDPRFDDSRILISSYNQDVLLVGQTPVASLRVLAEKIAKDAPNVRRVYDEVTIGYPISLTQRSQDSLISTEVRAKMLGKKDLESGSIKIITENGTVYLMGVVTPEQAELAVDVARRVKGVGKVVKIFRYIQ